MRGKYFTFRTNWAVGIWPRLILFHSNNNIIILMCYSRFPEETFENILTVDIKKPAVLAKIRTILNFS